MFERFTRELRSVVQIGQDEARASGAPRIEAEQLLLAITTQPASPAATLLAEAGLDHAGLLNALRAERERSLAFAGVTPPAVASTAGRRPASGGASVRFGTSAKSALERTVASAKTRSKHAFETTDLLRAILEASVGTVPRALEIAGVDRGRLLARLDEKAL